MLPHAIYSVLADPVFQRDDKIKVETALSNFPVPVNSDFAAFFRLFRGPVGSDYVGYQLLDLIEEEPCMLSSTAELKDDFDVPDHFLVMSDFLADGILVYDCSTDRVYDVDFEGGLELLLKGEGEARWESFNSFLSEFFDL